MSKDAKATFTATLIAALIGAAATIIAAIIGGIFLLRSVSGSTTVVPTATTSGPSTS